MRLLAIKLLYVICSPIVTIISIMKGVKVEGLIFSSGFPHINKGKNSNLSFGKKVRILNCSWMNSIGINHKCIITTEKNATLVIGNGVGISGGSIWCFRSISIDDNVRIGANCIITDGDAHLDDPRSGVVKPVHICRNVWLGMNVTVLKGVTIGSNSLIGAGSVVTKDIPANVVAAGNPCKVIKRFD